MQPFQRGVATDPKRLPPGKGAATHSRRRDGSTHTCSASSKDRNPWKKDSWVQGAQGGREGMRVRSRT